MWCFIYYLFITEELLEREDQARLLREQVTSLETQVVALRRQLQERETGGGIGRYRPAAPALMRNPTRVLKDILVQRDECWKINILIIRTQSGVRKEVCHRLCLMGYKSGYVRRRSAMEVEVVLVLAGRTAGYDIGHLAEFFSTLNVSQEHFIVDEHCRDADMLNLLNRPFLLIKSTIPDPENKSDQDFDMYVSDDGGYEIESVDNF
jgi:hypothetical protein